MNDTKSKDGTPNPSNTRRHIHYIPKYGKITCLIEESPAGFIMSCDYPALPRPRHRRIIERWSDDIVKPLESDRRPLVHIATLNGVPLASGWSDGEKGVVISGGVS